MRRGNTKSITAFFVSFLIGGSFVAVADPEPVGEGMSVTKVAGSDLIRHPTGMAFTKGGQLLVIESHTHFRPDRYEGPAGDQIVMLQDVTGDGVAEKRSVFFDEDLVATMDLAVEPVSGTIYVATRNEILTLEDRDGDGIADPEATRRKLVFLDTEGDYPHNGCSGLAFDGRGNVYFGIGENLGAAYTLRGRDGVEYSDQGEGGNVWTCRLDGTGLRRYATGFWNPFGVCATEEGFVFATDNDPGSRPPSRLHYVIDGGDYGYQYRYGRSGQHPFISWDGELPGTQPMLSGTGEAPCDVIFHEGSLYVASWGDGRIERYPLTWEGTHFSTEAEVIVQGEGEFRPVAFAIGSDGALYCSDWVKSDYKLHGEGAVWRITGWEKEAREMPVEGAQLLNLADADPWTAPQAIERIRKGEAGSLDAVPSAMLLLAARAADPLDAKGDAARFLETGDPVVKLLALKWISDCSLGRHREVVEEAARNPASPELFLAAVTALARIDGKPVDDRAVESLVVAQLKTEGASPAMRLMAFRTLPDRGAYLSVEDLRAIYGDADERLAVEVMIALRTHPEREAASSLAREISARTETTARVALYAREVFDLSMPSLAEKSLSRDDVGRISFHRHCAACHRVDGFGRIGGPDLSGIHARGAEHILESILEPGLEIAPQYEAWSITTRDGENRIGFLIGNDGGKNHFADIAGESFTLDYREVTKRESVPISLMPDGLESLMSEDELSDLVSWLSSPDRE